MECLNMHCLVWSSPSSYFYSFANFNSQSFPSVFFVLDSTRSRRIRNFKARNLVTVTGSPGDSFRKGLFCNGMFSRRCKDRDCDSEGHFSLEAKILEFMNKSNKPEAFPKKTELIDAGRMDLVDAILKKGGWLASGCDLDKHEIQSNDQTRVSGVVSSFSSSSSTKHSQPAISSETNSVESGIEGILSRLEKERKRKVLGFREKEDNNSLGNNKVKNERLHRTSTDATNYISLSGNDGKTNYSEIKSRFQQLQLELSSVLHSLGSSVDEAAMEMKLSNDLEFKQNKIKNAQNSLRSLRAELAVLEGKTNLALRDEHEIVEEKQRRIDGARKALPFLKTTYVYWPNKASEVLLAGSFDSWSSQRKMERSSRGIFSVCLRLYPGKYEIKFIVMVNGRLIHYALSLIIKTTRIISS